VRQKGRERETASSQASEMKLKGASRCRVSSRAAVATLAAKEPAVTSQRAGRGFLVIRIGEVDALPSTPCLGERDSTFTESELVRDGLEELVDTLENATSRTHQVWCDSLWHTDGENTHLG
jgi:hypothetical protein